METPRIFKPSHLGHPALVVFLVGSLFIAVAGSRLSDVAYQYITTMKVLGYSLDLYLPLFGIFPLILLGVLIHKVFDRKLILTDDYLLFLEGLVNWREKSIRIEYDKIKEIAINQTLYQKLLNIGDVIISGLAVQPYSEIKINNLKNPRLIKNLIIDRVKALHEEHVSAVNQ